MGIHLYTDNFYTNPDLYLHLQERKIFACGTTRKGTKGFPRSLQMTKAEENRTAMGTIDWSVSSPLLCVTWKDKRLVRVISTIHPLQEDNSWCQVRRHRGRHIPTIVDCPVAVRDYNIYMRGVDRGDQLITLYNGGRRTKKWWKRIFWHDIESILLNAHILYNSQKPQRQPYLTFKSKLVEQLIDGRSYRLSMGRPRIHPVQERLDKRLGHHVLYAESRRTCRVCSDTVKKSGQLVGRGTRVRSYCGVCKVHLCCTPSRNCFYLYHNEKKYWD